MLCNQLRQEVLKAFKNLHRTSLAVFRNNQYMIQEVRKKINDEYKKNKNVSEQEAIKELIKLSNDAAYELRTTVAEFEETKPGVYRLKLRPEMFETPKNIKVDLKNTALPKSTCCSGEKKL